MEGEENNGERGGRDGEEREDVDFAPSCKNSMDATSQGIAIAIVRANVRNVLFVSNRTCVQNAFVIFPNVKRTTCKHSNA